MDIAKAKKFVDQCWGDEIIPSLIEYIKIPTNRRPSTRNGRRMATWKRRWRCSSAGRGPHLPLLPGATLDTVRLPGRTPVIVIDVPGAGADTVLLYGHLDKQPEMTGWAEGYGPWVPRLEGDKLYRPRRRR